MKVGERWLPIRPGHASLVAPGAPLVYRYPRPGRHVFAHFAVGAGNADASRVLIPAMQALGDRFEPMARALEESIGWAATQPARAATRVGDLLWQLSDGARRPRGPGGERAEVAAARQFIERRLDRPIRVPDICRAVGLSHNHLLRLFGQATGQTLAAYIIARRAERARHLLIHTTMPINAIAATVGVADLQAFNKMMRRALGRSPRAIRQAG